MKRWLPIIILTLWMGLDQPARAQSASKPKSTKPASPPAAARPAKQPTAAPKSPAPRSAAPQPPAPKPPAPQASPAQDTRAATDPTDADNQFTLAYRLLQRGEKALATEAFEKFLKTHPTDRRIADTHYHLALLDRQAGRIKPALEHLKLVKDPLYVTPEAMDILHGQVLLEDGQSAPAVAILEKVDPKKIKDQEARASRDYLLGVGYANLNNAQAAVASFDRASEAESGVRAAALFQLGKLRASLNQTNAAIEALGAAAKASPEIAPSALSLAASLAYQQGQFDLAADQYQQIIRKHQSSDQFKPAIIGRLRALLAAGKTDALLAEHAAAVPLLAAQDRAEADYLQAAALVRMGKHKEASDAFDRFFAVSRKPDSLYGEALYLHAVCRYQLGHHDDVERLADAFVAQLPDHARLPELRFLHAQNAIKLGKNPAAIERLKSLMDHPNPDMASRAMLQRAALYEAIGRPAEATADYIIFSTRWPSHASAIDARRRAIDLAFSAANYPRVLEWSQSLLERTDLPAAQASAVRLKLALCHIKMADTQKAEAELDKILAGKPDETLQAMAKYYKGLLMAARISATPATATPGGTAFDPKQIKIVTDLLQGAMAGPLPASQKIEALHVVARLYRLSGQDAQALEIFQQLSAAKDPKTFDTPTALWIGQLWLQKGQADSALPWFTEVAGRAASTPAEQAEALLRMGQTHQLAARHAPAIACFQKSLSISSGFSEAARLGLAQCLRDSGKNEESLDQFDELVNVRSSRIAATALLESGMLQRKLAAVSTAAGDGAAAERRLTDARRRLNRVDILYNLTQLQPIPQRALIELALASSQAGQADLARQYLDKVIRQHAASPWAPVAEAERLALGGKEEAIAAMRKIEQATTDELIRAHVRQRMVEIK